MHPGLPSPTRDLTRRDRRRRLDTIVALATLALMLPLTVAAGGGPPQGPGTNDSDDEMVWVCKYTETPDGYLKPMPGDNNPIHVSADSVDEDSGEFSDAHASVVVDQEEEPDCGAENPNPAPSQGDDGGDDGGDDTTDGGDTTDGDDDTTGGDDGQSDDGGDDGDSTEVGNEIEEREDEPAAEEDGAPNETEATTCTGQLTVQVVDVLGDSVSGSEVTVAGTSTDLNGHGHEDHELECGDVAVQLVSVPDGYVFVESKVESTAISSQTHSSDSRQIVASVLEDARSTVSFVVDPLEVLDVERTPPVSDDDLTPPAPDDDPAPAAGQREPQPAPQAAPEEPIAGPTAGPRELPRTGLAGGQLLALAILLVTAGGAMLGSRRFVDR